MKILITGGTGFIGRNLREYLRERHDVFSPTHSELELLDEDAVRRYFKEHKFDAIIHTAVRPGHRNAKDPCGQLYNNLRMFFNIIRSKESFGKMILLSSGAVYDASRMSPKVREEWLGTYIPCDEHGFSKYIIARYIEKLEDVVELRIFGIFGKYEDCSIRFISNAICKSIFDLPITIKQNRRFDYIYVDDLMPVIEYFLRNSSAHKAYNLTPDNSVELLTLAEKVKDISGKDLPIIVNDKGMGLEYSGDNSRLKVEINSLNLTPIDTAIQSLYSWYRQNQGSIRKELLLIDK